MGIIFWVTWQWMRAIGNQWFGRKTPAELFLAGKCLLNNHSFRLPQKDAQDRLIAARELRAVLSGLWNKSPQSKFLSNGNSKEAIFSGTLQSENDRRTYIRAMANTEPAYFFHRQGLLGGTDFMQKALVTFILLSFFPWLFLICLFSRRRTNYALLMRTFVDHTNLISQFIEKGIREIYFFNIFDIDTNLLTWLCMQKGIKVTKISSDNPLGFHNQIIIGDRLATCNQYQVSEAVFFPNIRVKEIVNWLPEHYFQYIFNYDLPAQYATPPMTLGFYSSGSWRRIELGHADTETGFFEAESVLIDGLNTFLQEHPEISFTIFPHPYEKRTPELFEKTKERYAELFPNISITYPDREEATPRLFDRVDVAVSVYSTVSYERLFMGFKSLFFPYNMADFPIPKSGMSRISAKSTAELSALISKSLQQTRREFFDGYGLQGYSIEDFRDKFDLNHVRNSSIL